MTGNTSVCAVLLMPEASAGVASTARRPGRLGQSWRRWSCEFPVQMDHYDTRKHVVTSQQNELLHVQFRREG